MQRDAIDFGTADVSTLFRKLFVPTLLGMISISAVTAVDGIFVGHGVGSDGIAAINICIPVLMIFAGFGLMMGAGCSVAASIHLSKGNSKAARIHATQALLFATFITLVLSTLILLFPQQTARLLGSSETLLPQVQAYLYGFVPGLIFEMWSAIGLFVIRLDGSPKLAMWCNVAAAVVNIGLDWLFIFPLGMGVAGAAIASTISMAVGAVIALVYLIRYADRLKLYRLKATAKSFRLMMRNIGYQCRIGSSALLGEATMAVLMFVGNLVFMHYLGDYGVGAFGVACYYAPFVFMVGNAIAQSAQPIISYNFDGAPHRAFTAQRIALLTAFGCGLTVTVVFLLGAELFVGLFLSPSDPATAIAIKGLPLFAVGFIPFIFNLTAIGYYQSVERMRFATSYALLRGAVFLVPSFLLLPRAIGLDGIWLAMPLSETLTGLVIVAIYLFGRKRAHSPQ